MRRRVDARGLSCPMPVVMVKKALEWGPCDELEVLLDGPTACENVARFLSKEGFCVEKVGALGHFVLKARRP